MKPSLTPMMREKFLRFVDGREDLLYYAYHLNQCKHKEPIVDWLLRRRLTGEKFAEWVRVKHDNSFLKMLQHVVSEVNRTRLKPVIAGEDYGNRIQ